MPRGGSEITRSLSTRHAPRCSRLHSPLTTHRPPTTLTSHHSPTTDHPHLSPLTDHRPPSPLTTHLSPLTHTHTHTLPLTSHLSPSPLTTHLSPLTLTSFSPLTSHLSPSPLQVLSTTTAEALAMGKFVVIQNHPSNLFFVPFRNALFFDTPEEFITQLNHALSSTPAPLSPYERRQLSWEGMHRHMAVHAYTCMRTCTCHAYERRQLSWEGAAELLAPDPNPQPPTPTLALTPIPNLHP